MKKANNAKAGEALVNVSTKTFIEVCALLLALMIVSIVLTYVIPKGHFEGVDPSGGTNYLGYVRDEGASGIPLYKGLLAPILVFFSDNGLTLIMLSIFLVVIFGAFQVMNDVGGVSVLIGAVSKRFRNRRNYLLAALSLVFMCFGSFLGQFEEMLSMLPIVCALCVMVGFDSFTGFLVSVVSCGFGFATAITNPFTVLLASSIIGANPMEHILYRVLIFIVMYLLMIGFIFLYVRKLRRDPASSLTLAHDEKLRASGNLAAADDFPESDARRIKLTYTVFLLVSLILLICCSASPALRDYTVPALIGYFLIFGLTAGLIASGSAKTVFGSFLKGVRGALPTILFIALASSIKYIFDEGSIMPTIVNQINSIVNGGSVFLIALVLYLIILVLEFFISSSTAKAILVMGMLAVVNVGLSKQMLVLIYTFADGYTNLIFPTSPVLLIGLSMIGLDYFKWIKKSWPLFIVNTLLVAAFIVIGILIHY